MTNCTYTVEDFKTASFARHETRGLATRDTGSVSLPWRVAGGEQWSDLQMLSLGWTPVASRVTEHTLRDSQEKAARKREELVDHIADQDRVIRRRNDEIAALRERVRVAESGRLSLARLEAAWEAAEVVVECRKGDVLIRNDEYGGFHVYISAADGQIPTARILSRAPQREAWADLADVLKAWDAGESALDVDVKSMARWLHERGVRAVTGGDDRG